MPKIIKIGKYLFKLRLKTSGVFLETHCILNFKKYPLKFAVSIGTYTPLATTVIFGR